MRVAASALAIAAALTGPAAAAWTFSNQTDPMTDRPAPVATVPALSGPAVLRVSCVNRQPFPVVTFPQRVGFGPLGVSYRFDSGPVIPRMVQLSADGRDLWLWLGAPAAAARDIAKAKRLRVVLEGHFFEFDLTGGSEIISAIKC